MNQLFMSTPSKTSRGSCPDSVGNTREPSTVLEKWLLTDRGRRVAPCCEQRVEHE